MFSFSVQDNGSGWWYSKRTAEVHHAFYCKLISMCSIIVGIKCPVFIWQTIVWIVMLLHVKEMSEWLQSSSVMAGWFVSDIIITTILYICQYRPDSSTNEGGMLPTSSQASNRESLGRSSFVHGRHGRRRKVLSNPLKHTRRTETVDDDDEFDTAILSEEDSSRRSSVFGHAMRRLKQFHHETRRKSRKNRDRYVSSNDDEGFMPNATELMLDEIPRARQKRFKAQISKWRLRALKNTREKAHLESESEGNVSRDPITESSYADVTDTDSGSQSSSAQPQLHGSLCEESFTQKPRRKSDFSRLQVQETPQLGQRRRCSLHIPFASATSSRRLSVPMLLHVPSTRVGSKRWKRQSRRKSPQLLTNYEHDASDEEDLASYYSTKSDSSRATSRCPSESRRVSSDTYATSPSSYSYHSAMGEYECPSIAISLGQEDMRRLSELPDDTLLYPRAPLGYRQQTPSPTPSDCRHHSVSDQQAPTTTTLNDAMLYYPNSYAFVDTRNLSKSRTTTQPAYADLTRHTDQQIPSKLRQYSEQQLLVAQHMTHPEVRRHSEQHMGIVFKRIGDQQIHAKYRRYSERHTSSPNEVFLSPKSPMSSDFRGITSASDTNWPLPEDVIVRETSGDGQYRGKREQLQLSPISNIRRRSEEHTPSPRGVRLSPKSLTAGDVSDFSPADTGAGNDTNPPLAEDAAALSLAETVDNKSRGKSVQPSPVSNMMTNTSSCRRRHSECHTPSPNDVFLIPKSCTLGEYTMCLSLSNVSSSSPRPDDATGIAEDRGAAGEARVSHDSTLRTQVDGVATPGEYEYEYEYEYRVSHDSSGISAQPSPISTFTYTSPTTEGCMPKSKSVSFSDQKDLGYGKVNSNEENHKETKTAHKRSHSVVENPLYAQNTNRSSGNHLRTFFYY